MITFEMIPLVGAGEIKFGMSREQIHETMMKVYGINDLIKKSNFTDLFHHNRISISYNPEDHTVNHIDFSSHKDIKCKLLGIDVWETPGTELLKEIKKFDKINKKSFEWKHNPCFIKTIITLYALDSQYDYNKERNWKMWGGVGIGDLRYQEAVNKIYEEFA